MRIRSLRLRRVPPWATLPEEQYESDGREARIGASDLTDVEPSEARDEHVKDRDVRMLAMQKVNGLITSCSLEHLVTVDQQDVAQ